MYIDAAANNGLSSKFVLSPTGAFTLTGGTEKANDTLRVVMCFVGHFRVYAEDFVPPLLWMAQKPVSTVLSMKTFVTGKLTKIFSKYLHQITLASITFEYDYVDRKAFKLNIDYAFKGSKEVKQNFVTYISV